MEGLRASKLDKTSQTFGPKNFGVIINYLQLHLVGTDENIDLVGGFLSKKVFLKISQNSLENTSARVCFLNKVADWGLQPY